MAYIPMPIERFNDDGDAHHDRLATQDLSDTEIVDEAFAAILRMEFGHWAIHEVEQGRAGTLSEYHLLKEKRALAESVARHSGAMT